MSTNETVDAVPEGMVCIKKGEKVEFIYPVHADGWRAKGWEVTAAGVVLLRSPGRPEQPGRPQPPEVVGPVDPESPDGGDGGDCPLPGGADGGEGEGDGGGELEPEPEPERPDGGDGGEGDAGEPEPDSEPENPEGGTVGGTEAQLSADFGAMTKAEIIGHCKDHYGVLLDSSLTKAALVEQAGALAVEATTEGEEEQLVPGDLLI